MNISVTHTRINPAEAKPIPAAVLNRPEPTAAELAGNFAAAMARVSAAAFNGRQVWVSEAEYRARLATCNTCELWDGEARLGLGKCKAPKCGCSRFKLWLATEQCRHPSGSRWEAKQSNPIRT